MKISMPARTAHFKSGILFFNLKNSRHNIVDEDIQSGYDLCFVLDKHSVYVNIDPGLEFGVLESDTGEMYGPYSSYMSVVSLHLFGQYDNLIKFLRESFVLNNDIGAYQFIFGSFRYTRGLYEFTEDTPVTARRLAEFIPPMYERFEYEFEPHTYFADGSIEMFLNKLNIMFNEGNFAEEKRETENFLMGSVERSSGYGVRKENGKSFMVANLSHRRHSVFFAPFRMPVEYISFLSDGSQKAEDVMYEYITSAEIETVDNDADVEYYSDVYGVDIASKTVDMATYSLFEDIVFVLTPFDDPSEVYIFVKTSDFGIVTIGFDPLRKRFTIFGDDKIADISSGMTNANVLVDGTTLKFAYDSDIDGVVANNDLAIRISDTEFSLDCNKNRAYTTLGNVLAATYVGDLLNNIFV